MSETHLKHRQCLLCHFQYNKILIGTCSRRNMGFVHCMWQLVFTDIIINNELFIIYCDWSCLPDTYILCWTPDSIHDLIVHWTLALTVFITVHIFYCVFDDLIALLLYCISLHYMHVHLPLILRTHWEYWLSRFADTGLRMLCCGSGIWENRTLYEELEFSYFIILSRYSFIFLYSYCFRDSMHWTQTCFIPLIICYHVWTFICIIAAILIHLSDYVACSWYFWLSVYIWGIFLVYIRHQLSSWLRFQVFWEVERDNYSIYYYFFHFTNH